MFSSFFVFFSSKMPSSILLSSSRWASTTTSSPSSLSSSSRRCLFFLLNACSPRSLRVAAAMAKGTHTVRCGALDVEEKYNVSIFSSFSFRYIKVKFFRMEARFLFKSKLYKKIILVQKKLLLILYSIF